MATIAPPTMSKPAAERSQVEDVIRESRCDLGAMRIARIALLGFGLSACFDLGGLDRCTLDPGASECCPGNLIRDPRFDEDGAGWAPYNAGAIDVSTSAGRSGKGGH